MNKEYHIIGLMSGTSLDGLDIVKCTFKKEVNWKFHLENFETIRYSRKWRNTLKNLHLKDKNTIKDIDKNYGEFLAKEVNEFIKRHNIHADYISSHGHTIFHDPANNFTLQIGDGKILSELTEMTTISNFRELDVDLNGQGAPLVPIGDLLLFPDYKYCLNLGGFANISKKREDKIVAFDICAVNFILNHLSNRINLEYDKEGTESRKGLVKQDLLRELNSLDFFEKEAPKSLGREWVESAVYPIIDKYNYSIIDKLRTFTEHIAVQIGMSLQNESVLVTGGGAFNKFLMERIELHSKSEIILPRSEIINFKEAIIFAFLGVLRLENINNCLSSVTGAKMDSCSGDIYKK
ncbi:MAG TPA: anhydro-N-acetylmuramic acid kinase [Flavobacteriales bacterium]|nr:anhydro-N-acetylmuramic acid kinase [Flavobacteriales bacterium]